MATFTKRKRILVDTDAFAALYNREDSNNTRARSISAAIVEEGNLPILSVFSYGESITVISQKVGRNSALQYMDDIERGNAFIVEADRQLLKEGEQVYKNQGSKNASFTDCFNIAVMQQEEIKEIFSFDKIYKKNGFLRIGIDTKLEGEVVDDKK